MNNVSNISNANSAQHVQSPSHGPAHPAHSPVAGSPSRRFAGSQPAEASFDYRLHREHRALPLQEVLRNLKLQLPHEWHRVQVAGGWVWLEYQYSPVEPVCSMLFELGFHFNERRQLWQHPCGQFNFSPGRRQQFSYFPAQLEASAV